MRLTRLETSKHGTLGVLTDGDFTCRTIELPWRDNAKQISCIPAGAYSCEMVDSPKFGRVYHVKDVQGRSGILIHNGNFAGSVPDGLKSHSLGCILVGALAGEIGGQKAVLASKSALTRLHRHLDGKPFTLEVAWAHGD